MLNQKAFLAHDSESEQ